MFSYELKFVIDISKKWLRKKFFRRFSELNLLSKQRFKRENTICWDKTKCTICKFNLTLGASNAAKEKFTTYFDFAVEKEHAFLRNIFDNDQIESSDNIKTFEKYHQS